MFYRLQQAGQRVLLVDFLPSFGFRRHCVSGLGLGRGHGQDLSASSEVDDNSLSPEACYDCKINGYPKRGRKRRSTNETDALDAEVTYPLAFLGPGQWGFVPFPLASTSWRGLLQTTVSKPRDSCVFRMCLDNVRPDHLFMISWFEWSVVNGHLLVKWLHRDLLCRCLKDLLLCFSGWPWAE